MTLKSGHNHFLQNLFRLIIHPIIRVFVTERQLHDKLKITQTKYQYCHVFNCWLTNNTLYIILKVYSIYKIYPYIKFQMPTSNGSLVITMKRNAKYASRIHVTAILFPLILQGIILTKVLYYSKTFYCTSLQDPIDLLLYGTTVISTSQLVRPPRCYYQL
jgi:hypothetical protein